MHLDAYELIYFKLGMIDISEHYTLIWLSDLDLHSRSRDFEKVKIF